MIIEKLDLSKSDPNYYKIGKEPEVRDMDPYYYLTIEGQSSPDDQKFIKAIEALYSVAYSVKFLLKGQDMDFVVPKMEGFWFIKGGVEQQRQFANTPREDWCWKIMIRMPDFVESDHYFRAQENVKAKSGSPLTESVKLELINEGKSAQILHVGSYEDESHTIEKIHKFIAENGFEIIGYHHEIYLTDPRKTLPEKLKTIIRYSIK